MQSGETGMPGEVTREELHFRRIDCRGFRRSDGLFEVEGHLTDRKPSDFRPPSDVRVVQANQPIHSHWLRLVFDMDMVIREVSASIESFPYDECPQGGESLQALVGLRIGPGWNAEVRRRLPSAETCTHLKEMLAPLATAAYQSMEGLRPDLFHAVRADGRPVNLDSCYAYSTSRQIVMRRWPAFYRPASSGE